MNQTASLSDERIVRVQPRGLITIPRQFRDQDFSENNFIRIKKQRGRLVLEPVTVLNYPARRYTDQEIKEFFELDDQETTRLKRAKLLR